MTKKKTIKFTTLFIFSILTFQLTAQKIRPEIINHIQKIEKNNFLVSGYASSNVSFEKLREEATIEELLILLKHKNSIVKGYSSWALVDRQYPKIVDIFTEFLRTREKANVLLHNMIYKSYLANRLYYRVIQQSYYNKISKKDSLFFRFQLLKFDSIILFSKKNTYLLTEALSNNNGNINNYQRIRHLAFNKKNIHAIQALAIYQKNSDIPEFINLKKRAFLAIAKFPSPQFWDFLLLYKEKLQSRDYLMAVSAFKTEESAKVLSDIFTRLENESIQYLCDATSEHYCNHYQNLILLILEKHKIININAAKKIISDIPEKAANSFATVLMLNKNNNLSSILFPHNFYYSVSDSILPLILENINTYQKDKLLSICKIHISFVRINLLKHFLTFVKDNNLAETSEDILKRLQLKNQAFEIFHLTETILSFINHDDKDRLITTLKKNQKDWDWGNWSKSFRELFKKYDIEFE